MAAKKVTTTTTNKKTTAKVAAPAKGKAKAPAKKGTKKATPAKAKAEKGEKKRPTLKQILLGVGAGAAGLLALAAYGNHKESKGYTAGLEAKIDQITEEQTTVVKTEEEQQD